MVMEDTMTNANEFKPVDVNIQPEGFFFRGADHELYYARFAYGEVLGYLWAVDHMELTRCYMGLSK